MPPRPATTSTNAANVSTAYSLALLSEYTHTLDSLPLDLSRHFADLRELDAVLSSSMHAITLRIQALTAQIEDGSASKEERLWQLTQIAEEASRLKVGGEDKIRVASLAGDNLKSHTTHLRTLLEHIPGFDVSLLNRRTTYPHVSAKSYLSAPPTETGRRRRAGFGQLLNASAPDASPMKKRRVARDDDIDIGQVRSPRKEKPADGTARARNTNRTKKIERAPSPAESMISVTSHMPNAGSHGHALNSRSGASGSLNRAANGLSASAKRSRGGAGSNGARTATPQSVYDAHNDGGAYDHPHAGSSSQNRRDIYNNVPSSSAAHPSLPLPYSSANGGHYDAPGTSRGASGYGGARGREWSPLHLPATQLEGPGMPVSRSQSSHPAMSLATSAALGMGNVSSHIDVSTPPPGGRSGAASRNVSGVPSVVESTAGDGADADGDGDADDRRYCICDGPSYGNMIGCDDNTCEKEWFHLTCMNLASAPVGTWYCDDCKAKRNKRTNRGGKRRPNRAGGKAANAGV
ncbi:hypothetical protein HGRIS_014942 [Hohenbuehelia grisea]|uniref:Chromatin modification-related protein n=1 Tax=Hohenbuehelia grisea TaxID=104357 RepID=A0ABR3J8P8_9AGAR